MAGNPRVVTADITFLWDGVSQRMPRGQVIDVPAGSALEDALGSHNLVPLHAVAAQPGVTAPEAPEAAEDAPEAAAEPEEQETPDEPEAAAEDSPQDGGKSRKSAAEKDADGEDGGPA